MKKNTTITIVIAIVILALVFVYVFSKTGLKDSVPGPKPTPKLSQNVTLKAAPSKTIYATGEEISIGFSLVNLGETAVCLSEGALGNVVFTSFARGGDTIETRKTPSDFLASLPEILQSRLKPVAPGETMEFSLTSTFDPGLEAMAFDTTKPDVASDITTFYNVEEPGNYEIGFVYEYVAGQSSKCKDTLSGKTNKVAVTFKVE